MYAIITMHFYGNIRPMDRRKLKVAITYVNEIAEDCIQALQLQPEELNYIRLSLVEGVGEVHKLAIVTWTNSASCTDIVRIEVASKMMLYKWYLMVPLIAART